LPDYPHSDLDHRLAALSTDLEQFPPGALCPWPLARVFNELVKQAKRDRTADPILRGLRLLEERDDAGDTPTGDALIGTVRGLISQVRIALDAEDLADDAAVSDEG
jgi:hypothetical protein